MNWFTLSIGAGVVLVIVGIVFLIMGRLIEATLFFLVGAGLLCLDFTENEGEFRNRPTELQVKKIAGVVVLVVAIALFIFQIGKDFDLF